MSFTTLAPPSLYPSGFSREFEHHQSGVRSELPQDLVYAPSSTSPNISDYDFTLWQHAMDDESGVVYTDNADVKPSDKVRRRCSNCFCTEASTPRRRSRLLTGRMQKRGREAPTPSRLREVYPPSSPSVSVVMGNVPGPVEIYTDDASAKPSDWVRRRCFNCSSTQNSTTWRRSQLSTGRILCNRCGLFERTHFRARPNDT
ncbi:hypothetical protein C8R43DRAFT_120357 [Mycena crocata]|nr:hypothetical protein C8R43DRAFT_120357 [Mycena crocata]